MARHKDIVKQQLGDQLIFSALGVALKSASFVAAHAVTVDAKNQRAETYYAKYGFENLSHDFLKTTEYPKAMYLKMKDVRHMLGG